MQGATTFSLGWRKPQRQGRRGPGPAGVLDDLAVETRRHVAAALGQAPGASGVSSARSRPPTSTPAVESISRGEMGPAYERIGAEHRQHDPWTPELVADVTTQRRALLDLDDWDERVRWRDRRLIRLRNMTN